MKIVTLSAENIKRLRAVEITPKGNVVQITGKNGAGKTSVLDSIWWALAGAGNVQGAPIRTGENEARIRLDLGEIVVTRTFKRLRDSEEGVDRADGDYASAIVVQNAKGSRFPTPQRMLDDLVGSLSFDPLAFARMAPRDQFNELARFVPDVDFAAIEAAQRADFAERTAVNRRARDARAAAEAITVPAVPAETADEATLVDDLQRVMGENAAADRLSDQRAGAQGKIAALQEEMARFDLRVVGLLREIVQLEQTLAAAPPVPALVDVTPIRARIETAHAAAAARAKLAERERFQRQMQEAEKEADELTRRMADRETASQAAIAAAKMPVAGLGFGVGEVLLNGLPFDQASDAEKLRVSLGIAMASNPDLRVIRVRDGSLLDETSMATIEVMAQDRDYQVWIERVDDTGKVGFVIEDGAVKESAL